MHCVPFSAEVHCRAIFMLVRNVNNGVGNTAYTFSSA